MENTYNEVVRNLDACAQYAQRASGLLSRVDIRAHQQVGLRAYKALTLLEAACEEAEASVTLSQTFREGKEGGAPVAGETASGIGQLTNKLVPDDEVESKPKIVKESLVHKLTEDELLGAEAESLDAEAASLVGDGGSPNIFFVTTADSFMDDEKGPEYSRTISMHDDLESAVKAAKSVKLDADQGPRSVLVEDRLNGMVYERGLRKVVDYVEQERQW